MDPELAKDPEESLAKAPVLDDAEANESEEVGVDPEELELSLDSIEPDDESQGVTVVVGMVNVAVYVSLAVSYTHLRAHETRGNLVMRLQL